MPPLNLSDRPYFQSFKLNANSPPALIQLVQSRVSKGTTIVLARKVLSPSGDFMGMVTRSISPERLELFFSTILMPDSSLILVHSDGTPLARFPHFADALASSIFESFETAQASMEGQLTTELDNLVDGQKRLVSAKRLEHYPIDVVATKLSSAVLAGWSSRNSNAWIGSFARRDRDCDHASCDSKIPERTASPLEYCCK